MPGEEQAAGCSAIQSWWTLTSATTEVLKRHLAATSILGDLILFKVKYHPVKMSKSQLVMKVWPLVLLMGGCGCNSEGNEWLLWRVLSICYE